jgi:hypothetical protein
MDSAENQPARTLPGGARRFPTVWIFVVAVLAASLFVVFLATQERAPSHAGRSAELWLRDIFSAQTMASTNIWRSQQAAIEAFQQMEPDGIPFLTEALRRRNSVWNRAALAIHPNLPNGIRKHVPEPANMDILAGAASLVLMHTIDPQPDRAFPQLVQLLGSSDPNRRRTAWALVSRYAESYKSLDLAPHELHFRSALGDTNGWIRVHAVLTMLQGDMADSAMIPALSPALTSGDPNLSNVVEYLVRQLETLPAKER